GPRAFAGSRGARTVLRLVGRDPGARARPALRRDVRPAQAIVALPHLLRAGRQARTGHRAAAIEEALPRRWPADPGPGAARLPPGDARVRLLCPPGPGRAGVARAGR